MLSLCFMLLVSAENRAGTNKMTNITYADNEESTDNADNTDSTDNAGNKYDADNAERTDNADNAERTHSAEKQETWTTKTFSAIKALNRVVLPFLQCFWKDHQPSYNQIRYFGKK